MRILVTNDDGAGAHGLSVLHQIAKALSDDVWIVAPEMNQSGASHALTLIVLLALGVLVFYRSGLVHQIGRNAPGRSKAQIG